MNIELSSTRGRWIIAATVLGSGMVFLDSSVLNVALPRIQSDLAAPLSSLQWILDAYILFLATLLLVGGALGDLYGRKLVFIVGLVLFTLASIGCGLAPTPNLLIAARIVQGMGGALLVPGSLAMIKAVIAEEDAPRAIGMWTGLSGATTAIGPFAGGYLIDTLSWRAIFFLNVPLAIVTIWIAVRHVPANRDPRANPDLDLLGAFCSAVALGGIIFGLIEGPAKGWTSLLVVGSIVGGIVFSLLFLLREATCSNPMVPLKLFRSRDFAGANLATLGVYFCLYGALVFLVLDLQQVQGYSALQAGVATLPITVLLLALSPWAGQLMTRFGARKPMAVGAALIGLGFLLFLPTGRHVSYPLQILPPVLILGLGMSIFITPLTATVMGSVPPGVVGAASGINNALSRVAALIAIAVLGVVVASRFESDLSLRLNGAGIPAPAARQVLFHQDRLLADPIPTSLSSLQRERTRDALQESFLDGFRWAMGTCVLLCLASAIVSLFLISDGSRAGQTTPSVNSGA